MPTSVIQLTIVKAEALLALNPGGTSNPYITASIGAQSVTTSVENRTVNPVFNATFTFSDCPLPSIVTLRAFNKIQYVDIEDPLGTATVTLFDLQPEETTKVVQLSHGGNVALAQRAPNGCGSVTIRYAVTAAPEAAGAAASAEQPTVLRSKSVSITSAGGASMPLPVPAAINIDGSAAATIPVAVSPKDSHASTPRSGAPSATVASLVASNPNVTNPAATTPKLQPVEVSASASTGSAAAAPVYSSSTAFGLTSTQNSQLTPPCLAPARPPAVSTFMIPQVAVAPPPTAALNLSVGMMPNNGYTSYAVPGVKAPAPVSEQDAAAPVAVAAESHYANNSAVQPACTPLPTMSSPSSSSASMLPVAPNAPAAIRFASLQESLNAATSFDAQHPSKAQPSASASSLYTSAAQAPLLQPQKSLLVVPPNINGTPTLRAFPTSATPSQAVSRLPSATQLPSSIVPNSDAFPVQALSAAPGFGTIPVAVAPRTQPLSSSTSNSRRSTPPTLSSQEHFASASAPAPGFPAHAPVSVQGVGIHSGPAPALTAAGLQQQQRDNGDAAFPTLTHVPRLRTTTASVSAAAAATDSTTSPKRRILKREVPTEAAMLSAEALYADKEHLLAAAAGGFDEAIFRKLREVDPCLTKGFLNCVDYSGRNLLHIAAWNGQLRVLQILLAPEPASPMVDLRTMVATKSGNTVLHAAACSGQVEVAQWLRYSHPSAGPLLLSMQNARGMTAAECAMEAGFPQVARLLMPN
ncbi:hypothetical protein ABL78_5129 [Leptomonas seymouri]|uniref:C2 domain-containing protein n=1 Tax=Leptomonas seymouri TaxID=5684 RepID=A0A0N1I5C1_LEPSE|nr:hypothetical protein ABL78_5129 [Leptomonas seymouri]|eukprot:KPI85801.1 hypothetical protein ABL78_5129 [Leptomonas seymouri]